MSYDLLFLDIEMDDIDGIQVAKKVHALLADMYIVFITSHDEFPMTGYEVSAFRFLTNDDNVDAILNSKVPRMQRAQIKFKLSGAFGRVLSISANSCNRTAAVLAFIANMLVTSIFAVGMYKSFGLVGFAVPWKQWLFILIVLLPVSTGISCLTVRRSLQESPAAYIPRYSGE
jgi:hypothetical protein